MDQLIHALQQPQIPIISSEPLPSLNRMLALGTGITMLIRLPQPKNMRHDLRGNARLSTQTRDSNKRRQHTTDGIRLRPRVLRRIRQQGGVVAVDDVHGQVRVRQRQLVEQLALEAEVHAVPEGEAVGLARLDVPRRQLARRGGPRQRGRDVGRQACVEGAQRVDAARDPVERDALEPDLADQLGVFAPASAATARCACSRGRTLASWPRGSSSLLIRLSVKPWRGRWLACMLFLTHSFMVPWAWAPYRDGDPGRQPDLLLVGVVGESLESGLHLSAGTGVARPRMPGINESLDGI